MAKKSARRPRMAPGKAQLRSYSGANLPAARVGSEGVTPREATPVAARAPRSLRQVVSAPVDFASEYAHVGADLRRVLLIAGSLFAVLIALSFVIR